MSAASDAREELEAAIWRHVTPGHQEHGKGASRRAVDAILAAADAYAAVIVATAPDLGRARLDIAAAEAAALRRTA